MSAKSELPAPTSGFGIVSNQNRVAAIGVGRDSVIIGATETRVDNRPAFVPVIAKQRSDSSCIYILIEDEAHLSNRCQLRLGRLDVLRSQTRERLQDLVMTLTGFEILRDDLNRHPCAFEHGF